MMTLDEEIERFEKLASDYEFNLDMHQRNVMKLSVNDIERMKRNAQENRQRAEWLRELRALKENDDVKDVFKDCNTCKYLSLEPDDYPCDRCCHRYINQYVYDDKREVNTDEASDNDR